MEGFLKKRISLVRGYKNMWFVLKWDGYLQYFLQKPESKDQNPTGQMLLLLSDTTVKADGVSFKLVAANNQKYYLRASDKGKRDEWTKAINEVRTKLYDRMFKGIYDKPDHERCPTADDNAQNNMAFAEECKIEETELTDETSDAKADIASLFTGRKKPFVAVAAIDFGTTYSGCAFSTVNAFKTNPLKIETIPLDDTNVFSYKTPTVLLLTPKGGFHSFGARAESTYYTLAEKDEARPWYYFNRFKMQLYNNKELKSDMTLTELSGKTMKAVYVFAFCIEFIKDKVVKRLVKAIHGIQEDEIHWVLTVPAIWNDQARQFMIQAAQKAGIDKHNLSLALEPEGAAMCCKYLELEKKEQGEEIDLSSFNDNARFMVVDLGGGTIDITVSEVLSNGQLKEIYNATGGPWGGNSINTEIIKILKEIIGDSLMKNLVDEDLEAYMDLERAVEEKKRSVKTRSDLNLKIPDMLQKKLVISNAYKDTVKVQKKNLILSSSLMQKIFCTSVDKVIVHVRNLLARKETQGVSTILLVGGYAASEIVQKAFHDNFGEKLRIIFPLTPDMIVLKGAVIIGHMAEPIVGRIAKYHYGLALRSKAVSGNTISLGDNEKKTFFPLIAKGQQIKVGDIVTQYEIVLEARSTWANVEIYTTEEDEPRQRIDEEHFTKVGTINVKLPRFIKQSVLILTISYDETEFKVVATDKNTGRCFVGVCRFLEK